MSVKWQLLHSLHRIPRRVARKAVESILLCKWKTAGFSLPRGPLSSNCDYLESSPEPGSEQGGLRADKLVYSWKVYWASTLAKCSMRHLEGARDKSQTSLPSECPVFPQNLCQLLTGKFCKLQFSLPIHVSEASLIKVVFWPIIDWNQQIRRLLEINWQQKEESVSVNTNKWRGGNYNYFEQKWKFRKLSGTTW